VILHGTSTTRNALDATLDRCVFWMVSIIEIRDRPDIPCRYIRGNGGPGR
jgi:hypothetical protein